MGTADFPNLQQLRTFVAVARLESLSRAAAELHRSQPGVTQTLAKLERDLDVHLLERSHSGSYLTACGRILHLRTQRLFTEVELALTAPLIGPPFADRSRLGPILRKVTSNHLRCLVALADSGSIESAARSVDISMPSLNRILRELGHIIGRRLTRDTVHGLSLTRQAAELARRLNLARKEIEYAREEIAAARGAAQTHILIGIMPQCATATLVSSIDEFLRREPEARVKVEQKPYDSLLADLRTGRIDFLYGVLRKPDWATDVHEEPLLTNPYLIMVRKRHPLTRQRSISLEDLADYDWILPRPGTPRRTAFESLFQRSRRKPTSAIETSAIDIQVAMVAASDRITMVPAYEITRAADAGAVVALDFRLRIARGHDGVATRAGWHPTAGKLSFLEILRDHARRACASDKSSTERVQPGSRIRWSGKEAVVSP
jgi:LysR family transcriptional regulator, regulator for genes of the gallate degradation pathway